MSNIMSNKSGSKRRQRGMAMMETLVSLFLLAVGLLGTLAMQVKGANSNQRAQFSTEANILAEDMANRILGYVRNLDATSIRDPEILNDFNGIDTSSSGAADPGCLATGCNRAQQRQYDEWQWSSYIKSRLPSGIGQVDYSSGVYEITVMWNHDQIENPTSNCSGGGSDLACFVYQLKLE